MKIFVLGNPLIEEDSIALKVMKRLRIKGAEFEWIESLLDMKEKKPVILDAVQGIKKIQIFKLKDLMKMQGKVISLHDFDLPSEAIVLKKTGRLEDLTLIGIPFGWKEEKALKEVKKAIIDLV